jgi:hypothetical protein
MATDDRNAELSRRYFWLWFVAAALAFAAAGIDFYRTGAVTASLLVPGFLCALMGFVSRSRGRRAPPR